MKLKCMSVNESRKKIVITIWKQIGFQKGDQPIKNILSLRVVRKKLASLMDFKWENPILISCPFWTKSMMRNYSRLRRLVIVNWIQFLNPILRKKKYNSNVWRWSRSSPLETRTRCKWSHLNRVEGELPRWGRETN